MWHRLILVALLILTTYGFLLRVYDLDGQSLWNDEAVSMSAAHELIDNGFDAQILRNPGDCSSMSLLNAVCLTGSIWVFGDTVFALRFPAAIFGTLMIPLVFYFTKRVTKNNATAMVAAALITFLMVEISWSRSARMYQGFQFFSVLSLCFFWMGYESRRVRWLFPFGLSMILAIFMHRLGLLLIPLLCIYLVSLGCMDLESHRSRRMIVMTLLGIGALGGFAYAVLNVSVDLGSRIGITSWMEYYVSSMLLTFPVIVLLSLIGMCALATKYRRSGIFLFISFWFPLYMLSVHYIHGSGDRFLYASVPIVIITAAYAMTFVPKRLASGVFLRYFAFAVLSILVILVSDLVAIPQTNYYRFDRSLHISDMKTACEYVNDHRCDEDIVVNMWDGIGWKYLDEDPEYYLVGTGFRRSKAEHRKRNELEEVIQGTSGWLIADMGGSYMKDLGPFLETLDLVLIIDNGTPDEAYVYHWD